MTSRGVALGVALVSVWAALAAFDVVTWPWSGYTANHRNIVLDVVPGGPAEAAGMQAGDRILEIDGRETHRPGDLSDLRASAIGKPRDFLLQRGNESLRVTLRYGETPRVEKVRTWLGIATGLAVLAVSVLAWRANDHPLTRWLALGGIGFSLALMPGPWFESEIFRFAASLLRSALVLMAAVAALQFVRLLPAAGRVDARKPGFWTWFPVTVLWLLLGARSLWPETAWIDTVSLLAVALVLSGYLLAGTIRFLRNYIRSPGDERSRFGLRWMFWATVLGVLPGLLGGFTLLGQWPPARFFFVSAVLIPIGWSHAARRVAASGGP